MKNHKFLSCYIKKSVFWEGEECKIFFFYFFIAFLSSFTLFAFLSTKIIVHLPLSLPWAIFFSLNLENIHPWLSILSGKWLEYCLAIAEGRAAAGVHSSITIASYWYLYTKYQNARLYYRMVNEWERRIFFGSTYSWYAHGT